MVDVTAQVAVKLIRRESVATKSKLNKVQREISVLQRCHHPNIVKCFEVVTDHPKYIGIILEYASGGELFDYILTHRYLKDGVACRLFAQLVSAVEYLHSHGIVHRDLKLENLLLDRNRNVIITDFGFANVFDMTTTADDFDGMCKLMLGSGGRLRGDLMQTSCGSPCYAAPELVVSEGWYCGRKVDVWSCGVILYAMLAGYLPYDDDPANPEGDNINLLYKYIVNTPLTFPEYVTPLARDLLRRILVANPAKRALLKEVIAHPWLAPQAKFLLSPTLSVQSRKLEHPAKTRLAGLGHDMHRSTSEDSPRRSVSGVPATNHLAPANVKIEEKIASPTRNTSDKRYSVPTAGLVNGMSSAPVGPARPNAASRHVSTHRRTDSRGSNADVESLGIAATPAMIRSVTSTGVSDWQGPRAIAKQSTSEPTPIRTSSTYGVSAPGASPKTVAGVVNGGASTSSATAPATRSARLPPPRGRPRPTSYHPGFASNGLGIVLDPPKALLERGISPSRVKSSGNDSVVSQASSIVSWKTSASSPKSTREHANGEIARSVPLAAPHMPARNGRILPEHDRRASTAMAQINATADAAQPTIPTAPRHAHRRNQSSISSMLAVFNKMWPGPGEVTVPVATRTPIEPVATQAVEPQPRDRTSTPSPKAERKKASKDRASKRMSFLGTSQTMAPIGEQADGSPMALRTASSNKTNTSRPSMSPRASRDAKWRPGHVKSASSVAAKRVLQFLTGRRQPDPARPADSPVV